MIRNVNNKKKKDDNKFLGITKLILIIKYGNSN